jgi:hypothetical protein
MCIPGHGKLEHPTAGCSSEAPAEGLGKKTAAAEAAAGGMLDEAGSENTCPPD